MPVSPRHPLTLEEVRHIAKLARLRLSEADLEKYRTQLSHVLDYIAKLSELDVTGVEPMAHPTDLTNRLDEDEAGMAMPIDHLLRNAPSVENRYLAVPKILADEG